MVMFLKIKKYCYFEKSFFKKNILKDRMTHFNIFVVVKRRRDNKKVITWSQKSILVNNNEFICSIVHNPQ